MPRLGVHAEPGHPVWSALAGLGDWFSVREGLGDDIDDIDAAYLGADDAGAHAEGLLGRGTPVLMHSPSRHRALASALRAARRSGVGCSLVDLSGAVHPLVTAARERLGDGGVSEVEVSTPEGGLDTALRVLHAVLPALRPWRLTARTPGLAVGTVAGAATTIAMRPATGPADLQPDRIVLRGPAGTVIGSADGVTWLPGPFGGEPSRQGGMPGLVATLRERLATWHAAVAAGRTGARDAADAQLDLSITRLAEELNTALGETPPPTFPPGLCDAAHQAGLRHAGDPSVPSSAARDLDRTAVAAMAEVLGGPCGDGRWRTVDDILGRMRAAGRHAWILRRWVAVLTEEGLLEARGGSLRAAVAPRGENGQGGADGDIERAYAALGFPPNVGAFHAEVRARLAEIVRDETSVRELLFPRGGTEIAEALYARGWPGRYLNAAVAHAVRAVLDRAHGTPTVLELGAGVGATTTAVLDELAGAGPPDLRYVFSDISRLFLVAAARRQRSWPGMRHALLDIDGDLVAQGAPAGSADAVVAAHVLHNAVEIGRTLHTIRATLREGGMLAVIESTRESYPLLASMQFLMSADDGGARPGSADGRAGTDRIFLDAGQWRAELAAAGFRVECELPPVEHEGAALGQTLLIATAGPPEGPPANREPPEQPQLPGEPNKRGA